MTQTHDDERRISPPRLADLIRARRGSESCASAFRWGASAPNVHRAALSFFVITADDNQRSLLSRGDMFHIYPPRVITIAVRPDNEMITI